MTERLFLDAPDLRKAAASVLSSQARRAGQSSPPPSPGMMVSSITSRISCSSTV